jgi:hypothetical protein
MVVDDMAEPLERVFQMFFQQKTGMIGADSHLHRRQLYYGHRHRHRTGKPGSIRIGAESP